MEGNDRHKTMTRRGFVRALGSVAMATAASAAMASTGCSAGSGSAEHADDQQDAANNSGSVSASVATSSEVQAGNVPSNYGLSPYIASDGTYDYFASWSAGGICRAAVDGTSTQVIVEGIHEGASDNGTSTVFSYLNLDGNTLYYLRSDGFQSDDPTVSVHAVATDGSGDHTLYMTPSGDGRRIMGLYLYDHQLYMPIWGDSWEVWSMAEDGSGIGKLYEMDHSTYSEQFYLTEDTFYIMDTALGKGDTGGTSSLLCQPSGQSDYQTIEIPGDTASNGGFVVQDGSLYVLSYDEGSDKRSLLRMSLDDGGVTDSHTLEQGGSFGAMAKDSVFTLDGPHGDGQGGYETSVGVTPYESDGMTGTFTLPLRNGVFSRLGVADDHLLVSDNGEDGFLGGAVCSIDYEGNTLHDYVDGKTSIDIVEHDAPDNPESYDLSDMSGQSVYELTGTLRSRYMDTSETLMGWSTTLYTLELPRSVEVTYSDAFGEDEKQSVSVVQVADAESNPDVGSAGQEPEPKVDSTWEPYVDKTVTIDFLGAFDSGTRHTIVTPALNKPILKQVY